MWEWAQNINLGLEYGDKKSKAINKKAKGTILS